MQGACSGRVLFKAQPNIAGTVASSDPYHPLTSAIEFVLDQAMLIPDWKHLDVATLKTLVTSQTGIDSLVAVRDQDAVWVMDVIEEVNQYHASCPLLIHTYL